MVNQIIKNLEVKMKVFIIIAVCLIVAGCDNATATKMYPDDKTVSDIEQVEADAMKAEAEAMITDADIIADTVVVDNDVEVTDNQQPDDVTPEYLIEGNVVTDLFTGYKWQRGMSAEQLNYEQAISYCDNLVISDLTHWRVPTISQIKTLIRDCPDSMTGGACQVSDTCNSVSKCQTDVCGGCYPKKDRTPYFAKDIWTFPAVVREDMFLLSNTDEPDTANVYKAIWVLYLLRGATNANAATDLGYVKCVR